MTKGFGNLKSEDHGVSSVKSSRRKMSNGKIPWVHPSIWKCGDPLSELRCLGG